MRGIRQAVTGFGYQNKFKNQSVKNQSKSNIVQIRVLFHMGYESEDQRESLCSFIIVR